MESGKLEIVRGVEALDLSDLVNYAVEDYEGFGMPAIRRISERGPLQHGESDRGFRLDPRLIQLVLVLRSSTWADYYARRQEILNYLTPTNANPVALRFTQPDGTVRQIDGHTIDGPVFVKAEGFRYLRHRAAVRLTCPDPAWYDPTRQSVRVVGGGGGTGFLFPGAVPWTFGGVILDEDTDINYLGSWYEYPEIQITGPIENARVENLETSEVLEFGGAMIDSGDSYTIDLRYGYKTVVDGSGGNKIGELTQGSDLATWHLQPGVNSINYSGVNTGAATSMVIRWYNRYLGV